MLYFPFRPVVLTRRFPGQLYLTNMPGYWQPAEFHVRFWRQLTKGGAEDWVLCLAGEAERKRKAPDYPTFLEATGLSERWLEFPVRDRSVPDDLPAFLALLDRLVEASAESENRPCYSLCCRSRAIRNGRGLTARPDRPFIRRGTGPNRGGRE